METHIQYSHDPCPKGIVNQLLEIAKENDAMNEIGGATGWRWQEGIISRMPKKKTVARILTRAFKSDEPEVWFKNTEGDLKKLIKNNFKVSSINLINYHPKDIYEVLVILSTHDGRGVTFEELVFRLSYIYFCKNNELEPSTFILLDEELMTSINKEWAVSKANFLLDKFSLTKNENGYYSKPGPHSFKSPSFSKFTNEINQFRLKAVGCNSNFDMWKFYFAALTDDEMIEIEYKIIEFYEALKKDLVRKSQQEFRDPNQLKTRLFRFSCSSLPNSPGEPLKQIK